ncbi:elongator complex protein 5 [Chelonia mydas]|uniref:elongator complex protein 5 n=1 Tax=Chelonia mydas TaxID=8469 RepID=UPI001CA95E83|nr:elongator complex protein 5 [Chelonia mydas]
MLGELVAGATGGLVLIQDTVECEGRSLLKTFVAASAHRGESVHVFGFEIPEEEFRAGFDPDVTARLLYQDGFTDPLRWTGEAGAFGAEEFSALGVAGRLAQGPAGPVTVVLDSLSWLLLRQPLAAVCQTLERIPRAAAHAGLRVTRILALLHGDLHPPGLVETLHSLARAVVGVGPAPEGVGSRGDVPRLASMLQRKGTRKVLKKEEYYTVLAGFTPKALGEPTGSMPQDEEAESPSAADPTANLTFNLRLSDTERQARDGLLLPFHFTAQKKSSLLEASANAGKIFYEPDAADDLDEEDPDDDLDV